ncbi:MAG: tRNA dihydrouridine synthase DusB [Pseudomonadota bacterium]
MMAMTVDLSKPISIGPVHIRNRAFLAPLSGVSDLPFRKRAWRHGAGLVVTEMIASREFCKETRQSMQRALFPDDGSPRMLQLAGTEPRWMAEAALLALDQGAQIIDINMGCPAKKVTGVQSGSALMRDLDHALTLVEATVGAVDVPVTLKMRLGWSRETMNAPELARRAVDAGVRMITVHGRTRDQFYEGSADWHAVKPVRDAIGSQAPLVVNGDIDCVETARTALAQSGADAVMVGRGACGQLWLPATISGHATDVPGSSEYADYVVGHYDEILEHYGGLTGVRNARKHLGWYLAKLAPSCSSELRADILRAKDPGITRGLLRQAFLVPDYLQTQRAA